MESWVCRQCKESKPEGEFMRQVLEFDHRDPATKTKNIS
jgi:hypothetical protein